MQPGKTISRTGTVCRGPAFWRRSSAARPHYSNSRRSPAAPRLILSGREAAFRNLGGVDHAFATFSRQEKITLFTVFATALNVLFYRYTGQEDIVLGIPLADRDLPELQTAIGFLLHTHALRTQISDDL